MYRTFSLTCIAGIGRIRNRNAFIISKWKLGQCHCICEAQDFHWIQQSYKVGVSHYLPFGSEPSNCFCLLVPDIFWNTLATETNRCVSQKQEEKEDKDWCGTTPTEMKLSISVTKARRKGGQRLVRHDTHGDEVVHFCQLSLWRPSPAWRAEEPVTADVTSRNKFNNLLSHKWYNSPHGVRWSEGSGGPGVCPGDWNLASSQHRNGVQLSTMPPSENWCECQKPETVWSACYWDWNLQSAGC